MREWERGAGLDADAALCPPDSLVPIRYRDCFRAGPSPPSTASSPSFLSSFAVLLSPLRAPPQPCRVFETARRMLTVLNNIYPDFSDFLCAARTHRRRSSKPSPREECDHVTSDRRSIQTRQRTRRILLTLPSPLRVYSYCCHCPPCLSNQHLSSSTTQSICAMETTTQTDFKLRQTQSPLSFRQRSTPIQRTPSAS